MTRYRYEVRYTGEIDAPRREDAYDVAIEHAQTSYPTDVELDALEDEPDE